jgi:hypothetical protein
VSAVALQNLDSGWHAIFEKLGLNVVVVVFDTRRDSPIHSHPDLGTALGLELQQIGAGYYDSSFYPKGSVWHFYHCRKLGPAMARLKAQLETRGLLGITSIMHAEESGLLRVWYSYDPEAIGKSIEG